MKSISYTSFTSSSSSYTYSLISVMNSTNFYFTSYSSSYVFVNMILKFLASLNPSPSNLETISSRLALISCGSKIYSEITKTMCTLVLVRRFWKTERKVNRLERALMNLVSFMPGMSTMVREGMEGIEEKMFGTYVVDWLFVTLAFW